MIELHLNAKQALALRMYIDFGHRYVDLSDYVTNPHIDDVDTKASAGEGRRFTSITLDQIRQAASWANFGSADPAHVVCRGLLALASGFATGSSVRSILIDLKLLGPRGRSVTKLGRLFLFDLYGDHDPIAALAPKPKAGADAYQCMHGVNLPHRCRDCENEPISQRDLEVFKKREGIDP